MNTQSSRSNNVTVDNITVQTQAIDATEISKTIGNALTQEMKNVTNNYEDNIRG